MAPRAAKKPKEQSESTTEAKKPVRASKAFPNGRPLLIVESPSKAKTIEKYLKSRGFIVKASVGHIKDLPKSKLGVDVEKNFKPEYQTIPTKVKVVEELKKYAEQAPEIYLAPDPDREGEAIAWHIAEEMPRRGKKIHRVLFNAITKKAVEEALDHPTTLDENKFQAQQARRVLDRLVGYKISPLLWDKVKRGLSAGRVQSVAVRLVVEREEAVKAFKPEEYWTIDARFTKQQKPFLAHLAKINSKDPELTNKSQVDSFLTSVKGCSYTVSKVVTKERQRKPSPPFITSKLQQEASSKLGFSAKKTMALAQSLYEGKDLGELGQTGLVTYIRTDSVRTTPEGIEEVRQFIQSQYGKDYLPAEPNAYKTKKSAQDAHEAIRPTSLQFSPQSVQPFLDSDEFRLYELIWNRFVSSQMNPAIYDRTTLELSTKSKGTASNEVLLRLTGSRIKFPGFTAVYEESRVEGTATDPEEDDDSTNSELPDLKEGETYTPVEYDPEQHFTQPPPRFSDASLIKELEERGIGRPSTYAAILSNIQDKEYVEKRENRYYPSELGVVVNDLLVAAFPEILDSAFTAAMEEKLDLIEEGKSDWVKILKEFYAPFEKTLEVAKVKMKDYKRLEIPTDHRCEKCNAIMLIKWGRQGTFLACSNYPDCKFTHEFKKDESGKIVILPREVSDEKCPKCGKDMLIKNGKYGKFLACSDYPDCKTTKVITTGIQCPTCKTGELAQKMSRFKRFFYGCSSYPKCNYAIWDKPVEQECPDCHWPILTEKTTKRDGAILKCPQKECGYKVQREETTVAESSSQAAG